MTQKRTKTRVYGKFLRHRKKLSFISWNWGFNLHWTCHDFDLTHTNKLKLFFNLFDQGLQTMHDIFLKSGTCTFYTIALKNIAEFLINRNNATKNIQDIDVYFICGRKQNCRKTIFKNYLSLTNVNVNSSYVCASCKFSLSFENIGHSSTDDLFTNKYCLYYYRDLNFQLVYTSLIITIIMLLS